MGAVRSQSVARVGYIDCAKQAWEGRKGCKKQIRNPSAEPCGWKARPVTPDQRPEVSLAWGEATSTRIPIDHFGRVILKKNSNRPFWQSNSKTRLGQRIAIRRMQRVSRFSPKEEKTAWAI